MFWCWNGKKKNTLTIQPDGKTYEPLVGERKGSKIVKYFEENNGNCDHTFCALINWSQRGGGGSSVGVLAALIAMSAASAASAADGATTASDEVTSSKKKQEASEAGKTKVFSGTIAFLFYIHFRFNVQKACTVKWDPHMLRFPSIKT